MAPVSKDIRVSRITSLLCGRVSQIAWDSNITSAEQHGLSIKIRSDGENSSQDLLETHVDSCTQTSCPVPSALVVFLHTLHPLHVANHQPREPEPNLPFN